MNLLQDCIDNYGYNEPILTEELQEKFSIKSSTLRMKLKLLTDSGQLKRYAPSIYYIPNPNSLLKNQPLSINKVVRKKYLYTGNKPIKFNFADCWCH